MIKIKQKNVAKKIKQTTVKEKIPHEDFAKKIGASKMSIESANRFIQKLKTGVIMPRYQGDSE